MASAPETAADPGAQRRAGRLLGLGAALGLLLACVGILREPPDVGAGLPEGAVASVNGVLVRRDAFERAVQALASDRRAPIGEAEKRHVLDRLVDEELLVQRGLELGLAQHDRRVRGDLVSAVIQAVVSQLEGDEPDDAEVAAFYAEQRDYFARSGRLHVQQILVRGPPARDEAEALARAEEAARRLRAGEDFDAVDAAVGDRQVAPPPADLLPATKLREYLGPTATRAAQELEPGAVSAPQRSGAGYHVLRLVAREPGVVPPLDEIREEVRAELRRRAGDRALRDYLAELRERAELELASELP
jgi:parvulin-like peptidyl-prolyl isomerase